MRQKISMLMDGELCDDEAEALLINIKRDPEAHQDWLSFHLIGDVMRQPDYITHNMSDTFFKRLQAEPTVLAPPAKRSSRIESFAMSAVASIMAMALLAWLTVQINTEPVQQQLAQQRINPFIASSSPVNDGMNDYLLAHHEYSPSTDVRGAASYIRTVTYIPVVAGQ